MCSHLPLTVITGDDGAVAIPDPQVADAVRGGIQVLYTGLASPDEWGPCRTGTSTDPLVQDETAEQDAYEQFQAAFTGKPACGITPATVDGARLLSYRLADLGSGQAMITHDAAAVAINAARLDDPSIDGSVDGGVPVRDPGSQVGILEETRCANTFPGASGWVQFNTDPATYGNPIGKALPIIDILGHSRTKTLLTGPGTTLPDIPAAGQAPPASC